MAARAPDAGNRARFPRKLRLKRRRLIRPLFDRSATDVRSAAAGNVRLLFRLAPREDSGADAPFQVGFAVPRGLGPATARNRAKRRLRTAFQTRRRMLDNAGIPQDKVLTIMVVLRGQNTESETLSQDLEQALSRLLESLSSETDAAAYIQ